MQDMHKFLLTRPAGCGITGVESLTKSCPLHPEGDKMVSQRNAQLILRAETLKCF